MPIDLMDPGAIRSNVNLTILKKIKQKTQDSV